MKTVRSAPKLALALFVCAISALAISAYAQAIKSPVEQEIVKLENDWMVAWKNGDAAFLEKLFADEYLSTDSDGTTNTKAQELANVKSKTYTFEGFDYGDMKIHIYGDTAIVTGENRTKKAMYKGKDISGTHRFTDGLVKRGGRWQVVATQSTAVPKK